MPRRYKSVEEALADGVMKANSALDEAKVWVWVMSDGYNAEPALAEHGPLLLAGLEYFNADSIVSPASVDAAIDRAAAVAMSVGPYEQAIASWDAAEDGCIGKQGYRADAAAMLIGVGRAVSESQNVDNDAIVEAAVAAMLDHLVQQGAIDDSAADRVTASARLTQPARRLVDYLASRVLQPQ